MNIKTIKSTFLIIICIVIVNQISVAQVIKKYNGTYNPDVTFDGKNFSDGIDGKANYSYFENKKFERVFHGAFLFESEFYKLKINGNFKNNKKDGNWLYNENKDNSIITVKGKYSNGVMQGLWVYQEKNKRSNKVLKESIVTFKDGMLVGKYYFNVDYKVVGNFDSLGRGIGEWIITHKLDGNRNDKIEIRRKYVNDSITWRLKRNLSNGEILVDYNENFMNDYVAIDHFGNNKRSRYYFYERENVGHDALEFWLETDKNHFDGNKCPIFGYVIKGSDFISFEEREKKLNPNMQNENFNKVEN